MTIPALLISALSLAPDPVVAIPTGLELTTSSGGEVYQAPPLTMNTSVIPPLMIPGLTYASFPLSTAISGVIWKLRISKP